jgi:transcriptional regulator with XRE-family HTH domain
MGTKGRPKPARLAEKLLEIRTKLGISQNGMIRQMGLRDELVQAEISAYERGLREPPLTVLLEYARTAHILIEWLIDDTIVLPEKLPAEPLPEWVNLGARADLKKLKRQI